MRKDDKRETDMCVSLSPFFTSPSPLFNTYTTRVPAGHKNGLVSYLFFLFPFLFSMSRCFPVFLFPLVMMLGRYFFMGAYLFFVFRFSFFVFRFSFCGFLSCSVHSTFSLFFPTGTAARKRAFQRGRDVGRERTDRGVVFFLQGISLSGSSGRTSKPAGCWPKGLGRCMAQARKQVLGLPFIILFYFIFAWFLAFCFLASCLLALFSGSFPLVSFTLVHYTLSVLI